MTHRNRVSHAQRPLITDTWVLAPAQIPFPDCIPMEAGGGFILGGAGGSVFHFLSALRSSPSGRRVAGGVQAVRANAPRLAGTWTALSVAFSAVDSAMYSARRKEDPWNHMVAFAGATGLYNMRKGLKGAVRSAIVGAVFCGLLEVWLIGMENRIADPHRKTPLPDSCLDRDAR
uniref:Uncharacterized protein n=1 Tax=Avena sativa TaxID=4498 RepID=A0ACD5WDG7_AVESA